MSDHENTIYVPEHMGNDSFLVRFLKETQPAKLLLWSAAAIIIAGVCGIASVQIGTGWNINAAYDQWQSGTGFVMDVSADANRASLARRVLQTMLSLGTFLFGIVAALLPMWAVGRLIADAIKDGAKS